MYSKNLVFFSPLRRYLSNFFINLKNLSVFHNFEKTCDFFMSSEKTCPFFHNLKNLSVFHTLENTCNYSRSQNFFNIFSNYLSLDNVVNTCNIHYLIMNPIRPVFHIMPNYITCECCALEFGEYQTFDKPLLSIQL